MLLRTTAFTSRSYLLRLYSALSADAAPIRAQLKANLMSALKAKDAKRATVIRSVLADITNADKMSKDGSTIDDAAIFAILHKGIARRRDSAQQFMQGNRPELAQNEEEEIELLRPLLPPQLSDDQIDDIVKTILAENSKLPLGAVMKAFWTKATKAQVSTDVVSQRIRALMGSSK